MDRGRPGISQEEEPEGEQPMDEVSQLYSDERYVDVARSVLYVYSRPSGPCQAMPHPMGQIMTIKSRPPSVVLFHAFSCSSILFPCYPVVASLLHCTQGEGRTAANHLDLHVSSLLSTH